jgi:hypothetical protein
MFLHPHNEGFIMCSICYLPHIVIILKLAGHIAGMGDTRNALRILDTSWKPKAELEV